MNKSIKIFISTTLFLMILGSGSAGCTMPDSDNASARPWNQPRGFDTGIFGNDRRR